MAQQKKMSQNAFVSAHLERIALHENVFQEERNRLEKQLLTYTNMFAVFTKTNEELLQKVDKIERFLCDLVDEERKS